MSLLSALDTGTSGIQANTLELSVIGDNLANTGTVGFKSSRAVFEDALAQNYVAEGPTQVGLGTRLGTVQRTATEGSLMTTNNATDLALEGNGYFQVKGSNNGQVGTYYTRAGQFSIDKTGFLSTQSGLRVQGYTADATGTIGQTLGDLQVGQAVNPPLATGTIAVQANLDSAATPVAAAWNVATPTATSNFQTSVVAYDTLGAAHQIDIYFRKTAAGAWDWHALSDGGGLTGGTAGTPTEVAAGTMTFGNSGQLTASTQTVNNFVPVGAVNPQPLTFNFGTPAAGTATGLDGITQFQSTSTVSFTSQDGYSTGSLSNVSVDSQGQLVGNFSNGQTRVLGQVAVAALPDQEKLQRLGGNLFAANASAGSPTVGAPGSGGRATIQSGVLEQSNVDMTAEFVNMIAAQRNFQANSKTITTADSLLQELMNLKR